MLGAYNRQKNGNNFMVKMSWIEILSISASIATILGLIITIIKIKKKLNEFIRKYKKQIYYSIFAVSIIINIVLFFIILFVKELPPPDSNNEKLIIEINILRAKYDSVKVEYKSLADEYHRITENRNHLLDSLSNLKGEKQNLKGEKDELINYTVDILLNKLDSLISEGQEDENFRSWRNECKFFLGSLDTIQIRISSIKTSDYRDQFQEATEFKEGDIKRSGEPRSQTKRGLQILEESKRSLIKIKRRNQ